MHPGSGPLVLRPNGRKRRRKMFGGLLIAALFVVETTLGGEPVLTLTFAAIAALALALLYGSLSSSRIEVTPHQIAVIGLLFRRRRARMAAASVVRAEIMPVRGPMADTVFVLDSAGQVLIRISGLNYAREDIDRLVRSLDLPSSGPGKPVTAKQLSTMYPDLVNVMERRPFVTALVVTGAIVVLIMIVGIVVARSSGA